MEQVMKYRKAGILVEPLEGRVLFDLTLPAGFVQKTVASGLGPETVMAFAPDGRLFMLQQDGIIRIVKNGKLLPKVFIDLPVNELGERGLLGIAFDPNFEQNHYLYLYHTVSEPVVHNEVSRFTANGDVVLPGSEVDIFQLPALDSIHHNAGAIHFGPDGKLYIAVGENQVGANAQSLDTTLGKILRINPDGSIPTDNPFYNQTTGDNRAIWALGFRNPFTFAFQPGTGVMYINDVGNVSWEEIDQGVAGGNYGWPYLEGYSTEPGYISPVYAYPHPTPDTATTGNSITGGTFYDPPVTTFPSSYVGCYFFGDNTAQWIHVYNPATNTVSVFCADVGEIDVQVGPDGDLYIADRSDNSIVQVSFPSKAVTIAKSPAAQSVYAGQSVTFSVSATGTGPLTYQWQRDGVDIPGATSATYTLDSTTVDDSGSAFTATVTNANGPVTSHPANLTVAAADAPLPTIVTPKLGQLFSDGTRVSFSGKATDPSKKALKRSAFSWQVLRFDDGQSQIVSQTNGSRHGSFAIPRIDNDDATSEFYRVELTVTNPLGQSSTTSQDIYPRLGTITLTANTADVDVVFDGQTVETPYIFTGVVGSLHELQAPLTQDVDTTAFNLAVKPTARKLVVHTTPLTYVTRYHVTG
jgi:glucose/arabinose dehydrogenase